MSMVGEKWYHKKRGAMYEIVSDSANIQCSADPEFENRFADENFVVYRNIKTGAFWVRPLPEFMDGRFERVTD